MFDTAPSDSPPSSPEPLSSTPLYSTLQKPSQTQLPFCQQSKISSSSTKSNSSDLALSASSDRTLSQDGSPTPFTRTPKPRKYSDNVIYERTSKTQPHKRRTQCLKPGLLFAYHENDDRMKYFCKAGICGGQNGHTVRTEASQIFETINLESKIEEDIHEELQESSQNLTPIDGKRNTVDVQEDNISNVSDPEMKEQLEELLKSDSENEGEEENKENCKGIQINLKLGVKGCQNSLHSGALSDIDSASLFSQGFANSGLPFTQKGYNPNENSQRKSSYHTGMDYGAHFYNAQGEHTIQYLLAQQAMMLGDFNQDTRRKSHSMLTPSSYHPGSFYGTPYCGNFIHPFNPSLHSQSEMMAITQKKLMELQQSAHGFGDDQASCRFLQDMLEVKDEGIKQLIKEKTIESFSKLMGEKFGNYLCQKIVDYANEEEILKILENIQNELPQISVNTFGTRAVQKLIEVVCLYPSAIVRFSEAIGGESLDGLIIDNHGNHVVQQCLVKFPSTLSLFVFQTLIPKCIEYAQHRQGCCVVQRCLEFGDQEKRAILIAELIENCEILIPDQYGNYVLQHIINKELASKAQLKRIYDFVIPNLHSLAKKKYSSNFVEKCLESADPTYKQILFDILTEEKIAKDLLLDRYGNYVFQTALQSAQNTYYDVLREVANRYMYELRRREYGRPVLANLCKILDTNERVYKYGENKGESKKWQQKNEKCEFKDDSELVEDYWSYDAISEYQGRENRRNTTCPIFEQRQFY